MNCVQCGHELAEGAKFCPECGAKQQIKCPRCGASLDAAVKFCGECGAKVVSNAGAGETAPVSRIDIGPLALGLPECKVEITEVRAEGPSDDGDYGLTIKYSVTNDTDEDWEYFETRTQILNASGQILEETRDSNEQAISSGDTAELETSLWGVKGKLLGVNPEQAHVVVSLIACGFGQEKLGEVAIPEIPYEAVAIRPGRIGDMLQLVSGSLWKTEPDDDKDCRVEIKALVQNLTDKHLPQVKIVADVTDKQGRELTDAGGSDEVRPGNLVLISGSGYGKEKKLAGAKANFALRAYWPVAAGTAQQRGIMVADARESSESGGAFQAITDESNSDDSTQGGDELAKTGVRSLAPRDFRRYLRADADRNFRDAVVYVTDHDDDNNCDKLIGAYWGYAGGGVGFDGGFFLVDPAGESELLGFDDIEGHEFFSLFDDCMKEVARLYRDDDNIDNPALSDVGSELIDGGDEVDDGDVVFMNSDFDSDALGKISDKWAINLRFEW